MTTATADPILSREKHDASGTPISSGYSHGPGGLLTFPGVDPAVFSSIVGNMGILGQLRAVPSTHMNPTFFVLTGVGDESGSEQNAPCDDAPVAGLLKGGLQTSVFGRYERQTPEIDLTRIGQVNDRADPLDLYMVGTPIDQGGPFSQGARDPSMPGDALVNETHRKFWEANVTMGRKLARQIWRGTPSNNSAGGGYKEMTGFEILIDTGHRDAETNESLPSLDSNVISFGSAPIASNGDDLVNAITYMVRQQKSLAERSGLSPVRWVFVMRDELFWEITNVWPCSYLTYMCSPSGDSATRLVVDSTVQVRMRDEMRAGKFLLIAGERFDVILDNGIPFDDGNSSDGDFAAGCFRSDIYFIPMSVSGGRAVTYLEYFDWNNPSLTAALTEGFVDGITRQGPFILNVARKSWCVKWNMLLVPRLILRTPWLAAKIQNVVYCPAGNIRSPFPDEEYGHDDGKTTRPGPSFYENDAWSA